MTKAERKLLQKREAELYLQKEQYIDWFGKDNRLTVLAKAEWLAAFEILELLDVKPDYDLEENKKGALRQRAREEQEEQEIDCCSGCIDCTRAIEVQEEQENINQ